MNTFVYISCIIRATPASSIRVDDNCAQVASDSANYERPMCRSKHVCRREYENDGKWHDMNGLYPFFTLYGLGWSVPYPPLPVDSGGDPMQGLPRL